MPNFIVFSDLHLHNWVFGSKYINGINSRLIRQVKVLEQIEKYAEEYGVKDIYFCGDLFHQHHTLHLGPLSFASKIFSKWKRKGLKLTLLVGNHDIADKKRFLHALEPFKEVATVVDRFTEFDAGDHYVYALPFTEDVDELNKFLKRKFKDNAILLMHQGVNNVPVNSKGFIINDEILNPNNIPKNIKYAFVGHYHSHKILNNLVIPGSPMQHTRSDEGEERGWLHVTDNGIRLIPSVAPKFITTDTIDDSLRGNYVRLSQANEDHKTILLKAEKAGALTTELLFESEKAIAPIKGQKLKINSLIDDYGKYKKFSDEFIKLGKEIAAYAIKQNTDI